MKSIIIKILDLLDYFRCQLFVNSGVYRAYYVEKTVLSIGPKSLVNVDLHRIVFAKDDTLPALPFLPNASILLPEYSLLSSEAKAPLLYDEENKILFLLECKRFPTLRGSHLTSRIDCRRTQKKQIGRLVAFFESRIQASDKLRGARLEAIDTRENVSYKNLGKH